MIQPLPTRKNEWILYFLETKAPVRTPEGVILPVFLVLADERMVPVASPEIMAELDQNRAENLIRSTLDSHSAPERIIVAEHPDWDPELWREFSEQAGVPLRLRKIDSGKIVGFAENIGAANDPSISPSELAAGLFESSRRIRSSRRRAEYLRGTVELDPSHAGAHLDLADLEFSSGKWKACLSHCSTVLRIVPEPAPGQTKWNNPPARSRLRAIHLEGMVAWHQGNYREASKHFSNLLTLNPDDHQGARFFLPLLYLLDGAIEDAAAFFTAYEKKYPKDFYDPAFYFAWGFVLHSQGDEAGARDKYIGGMLKNIYLAPMLLEMPEPDAPPWHPNERSEPQYASEFVDSYAAIWDRDSGSLRFIRELWEEIQPSVNRILAKREEIAECQDQRYDPDFRKNWEKLLHEEEALTDFWLLLSEKPDTMS